MDWATIKTAITVDTGLSRDALHILTGAGLYFLIVALLPRRVTPWVAWFVILAAGLANEWADYLYETWPGQWKESLKDMITTLALPTLLLLIGRFAPNLLVRRPRSGVRTGEEPAQESAAE